MEKETHIYHYEGPVTDKFGNILAESIGNKHESGTRAVSEGRARANILFNWKRKHGYVANAGIKLPGKIIFVE